MQMNRPQLKQKMNGYIKHAAILHQRGNPTVYRTMARLQAIDKLNIIMQQCRDIKTESVALVIDKNADVFRAVLPQVNHKSYSTLKHNLEEMLTQCATYNLCRVW